jgi:hypothetical protein
MATSSVHSILEFYHPQILVGQISDTLRDFHSHKLTLLLWGLKELFVPSNYI